VSVSEKTRAAVRKTCRKHGGVIRTAEALRAGVHPRTLYALRDEGFLERLERGLYRLAELPEIGQPDLVTVALKVPSGVICLISALAFHDLTTQIPHEVSVALRRRSGTPRLQFPPIRIYWFASDALTAGVETHEIDGVPVRIYSPEKTLADCFKFRNKIGLETAVEALRLYRQRRKLNTQALMEYAAIDRVKNVMRPYLEAML
jgi:predicted transcriptional regulator of viral defense system